MRTATLVFSQVMFHGVEEVQARTHAQHWDLGELHFAPAIVQGPRGRKDVIRNEDVRSEAVG